MAAFEDSPRTFSSPSPIEKAGLDKSRPQTFQRHPKPKRPGFKKHPRKTEKKKKSAEILRFADETLRFFGLFVAVVALGQIDEARVLVEEGEADGVGGAVSLLGDD